MDRNKEELTALDQIPWVRLVRACGSKQNYRDYVPKATPGQARKSLWIETGMMGNIQKESTGQARKSLWIETITYMES